MKISIVAFSTVAFLATTLLAGSVWAQAPAGGPDMSKIGPWSRKPTNEAAVKKEIAAFFKQQDDLEKAGDMNGMLAAIDFPVTMMTDDSKGVPRVEAWNRDQYLSMMTGMMANMPKDMKVTHKPTVTVLSDSIVNVTDDFTMTVGKQKLSARNLSVLIKREGKWMWKVMGEAGWGDMPPSGGGAAPPASAPAKK